MRQTLPQELYQQIRLGLAAPTEVERTVPVSLYEKLELRVELKATFQNPYDPDDLDLWAEFTAPSGKAWKIWGFYNPTSPPVLWMVRFTPTETGTWRYVVKVHDREGTAESKPREATVVASKHHGFVRIAGNKRYLQFTDGSPFYGVGMWYNDGYELFDRGYITEQGLDDLKQHGANFISFFHSPLETMGTGLGRYDERRAGRYRTWRGEYLPPISAASAGRTLTVKIPELRPIGGRAQNIGDDVAIKIVKKGVSLGVPIGPLGPR